MRTKSDVREHTTRRRVLAGLAGGAVGALALTSRAAPSRAGDVPPRDPVPATPDEALAALRAGNRRFVDNQPRVRSTEDIEHIWVDLATGQAPFATVLGCADSRLAPEIIFDQFLGDIFVVREAGNIADSPTNLGSLEYAQAALGAKLLLVFGHTSCGAVQAAFEGKRPGGHIDAIVDVIAPGIAGASDVDDAVRRNVVAVQKRIREKSPLLREAESAGKMKIAGAVYDIRTGVVSFIE
ncbi:MAG TPA: carbonic anhydrase [Candidatus Binatia bacterium]